MFAFNISRVEQIQPYTADLKRLSAPKYDDVSFFTESSHNWNYEKNPPDLSYKVINILHLSFFFCFIMSNSIFSFFLLLLKEYYFEPCVYNCKPIEDKLAEFWDKIDESGMMPARGRKKGVRTEIITEKKGEERPTWLGILKMLQTNGLDKAAVSMGIFCCI